MAKDDYFVLVYRILEYLYKCLKNSTKVDVKYLKPLSKDFPVECEYWSYIIRNLLEEGYIENVALIPVDGAEPIVKILDNVRITPKGIEYLQDNSKMQQVKRFVFDVLKNHI